VYVGSRDDNLYAVNPDGTEKWSFSTGDDVRSSPAIGSDGTVYVGSEDNNLYAIGEEEPDDPDDPDDEEEDDGTPGFTSLTLIFGVIVSVAIYTIYKKKKQ